MTSLTRRFASLAAGVLLAHGASGSGSTGAESSVETAIHAVVDDLHAAAAVADGPRYFSHFASDGVFLGTDPGERWSLPEFREFAEPYFSQGRGWTYTPIERHVEIGSEGDLAWFDELLDNDSYGRCRGTGVLRHTAAGWKIVHYSLTLVVPNDVARDVAGMIRDFEAGEAASTEESGEPSSSAE